MIVTRTHLPRRTFLKGMGAVIALPVLDAMTPAFAAPRLAKSPLRLGFTYVPNGVVMADWTPKGVGKAFEFTRVLKPLERFREDTVVLSGLAHRNGYALGDGPGDHARAGASYLTGVHPKKTAGADIQNGISVDQIAAQHLAPHTRFGSLELGCDDSRTVGNCDSGYSCAYTNSLAWRGPATPMPPETNPRLVFERLFGDIDTSLAPDVRARRLRYRRSILDLVGERTTELAADLGPSDKRKLDEYLTSIREIERRIERAEAQASTQPDVPAEPVGVPESYEEHVALLFDLLALAYQTDLTRVFTFMLAREVSQRTYPDLGVTEPHHAVSHHGNRAEAIAAHTKVNTFHMQLFARFVDRLASTPDGDGSLLDHSLIVYGAGMSDGNGHTGGPLPLAIVGGGAGRVRGNRHIEAPPRTPTANALLSLAHKFDVAHETFGVSTGTIDL
jgi:hypothetical protein